MLGKVQSAVREREEAPNGGVCGTAVCGNGAAGGDKGVKTRLKADAWVLDWFQKMGHTLDGVRDFRF